MLEKAIDSLLAELQSIWYPNCTLYLIWHYLSRGELDRAHHEYTYDGDKLGRHRKLVEAALAEAAEAEEESKEER